MGHWYLWGNRRHRWGCKGHRLRKEAGPALDGRVEVARMAIARARLAESPQGRERAPRSDKTGMHRAEAGSDGSGPGKGRLRMAKANVSSRGSGSGEGSPRWDGRERGTAQSRAGRGASGQGREGAPGGADPGADLVQGADAVGVGGVEHGAGGRRGGGVQLGAGAGVGRAQHQARLVQVAARAGRQELSGALEAHGAGAPLPGARLGARPRPPLPQLLPPPLAGRCCRRPGARPGAVLIRHRAARPPVSERASERAPRTEPQVPPPPPPPAPGPPGTAASPAPPKDLPAPARRATSPRRPGARWEMESEAGRGRGNSLREGRGAEWSGVHKRKSVSATFRPRSAPRYTGKFAAQRFQKEI